MENLNELEKDLLKQITDTDPEFVLEYDKYIQTILYQIIFICQHFYSY